MTGVQEGSATVEVSVEVPDNVQLVSYTPVSYTHLDVYKRQDPFRQLHRSDMPAK